MSIRDSNPVQRLLLVLISHKLIPVTNRTTRGKMTQDNYNPLRQWTARLDGWLIFNPARWPQAEFIARTTALLIIGFFLVARIYQFDRFPQTFEAAHRFYAAIKGPSGQFLYSTRQIGFLWGVKLASWLIETGIFLGYIAAYVSRARAIRMARGFMETAYPIMVAAIPILISLTPYNLPRRIPFSSQHHLSSYLLIMAIILLGGLINLIGLLTLRRAFTIMTEARALITRGIFGLVRHPLYTGHFIAFCGSVLLRLHWYTLLMYALFCIGQVLRARIEERKLMQTFPEYEAYRKNTGMFLPKAKSWRRNLSAS